MAGKAPAKSIVLELETSFMVAPKGRYEVYVNLPKGTVSAADKAKHFAGSMHFFVIEPKAGQKGMHAFRFDLTDELNDPAVVDAITMDGLAITVMCAGGKTTAGPKVEKATIFVYECYGACLQVRTSLRTCKACSYNLRDQNKTAFEPFYLLDWHSRNNFESDFPK